MTGRPLFRARAIDELLNMLPIAFGFTPRESLIAVGLDGPSRRMGFRARIDLPESADQLLETALVVAEAANRHGGDELAVVAVSADIRRARTAATCLASALDKPIGPVVWASDDRFWVEASWCPREGIEWRRDRAHPAVVAAIAAGMNIVGDRNDLRRQFAPASSERRERVRSRGDVVLARIESGTALPIEQLLERSSPSDEDLLTLAMLAFEPAHLTRALLWPALGVRARHFAELWTQVGRVAPAPYSAGAFGLAAFGYWRAGEGARALVAVDACRALQPQHPAARLVVALIDDCVPPYSWPHGIADESA
jgi:hypothetical protein